MWLLETFFGSSVTFDHNAVDEKFFLFILAFFRLDD